MDHIDSLLKRLENTDDQSLNAVSHLRTLGLSDFCLVLWGMPNPALPKLSAILPPMASSEIQNSWTGSNGTTLLEQSIPFVRSFAANYADISGESLTGKKVLDFGCGYGRFLRLLTYYSDDVWGVDPWERSVELCQQSGLGEKVRQSDYHPKSLPVPTDFDAAIAFSVFTHLSQKTTESCLKAIRKHVKKDAVACITIRPIEYWHIHAGLSDEVRERLRRQHRDSGFAFLPHQREPVDGDITYGDTSMTIEYLDSVLEGWEISRLDRSINDAYQRYVFLRAT